MEDYWARSGGLLAEWPLSTSGGVFPHCRASAWPNGEAPAAVSARERRPSLELLGTIRVYGVRTAPPPVGSGLLLIRLAPPVCELHLESTPRVGWTRRVEC